MPRHLALVSLRLRLPALTTLLFLIASSADATLVHRYSFTSDASDAVGTAHGIVVDPGAPTAVFQGGSLVLSANTGQGSNAITDDAYVDLPNGIVSDAVNQGTSGAVSFEFWTTVSVTRTFQRLGDFGTSDGGEHTSASASTAPHLYITPNSGFFANGLSAASSASGSHQAVGQMGPLPTGVETHVVATYAQRDTSGGPNGTVRLYRDGVLVDVGGISPDLQLFSLLDNNNWLGRSQWPDPVFDGSYNEFRIYDEALGAGQIAASFAAGPDVVVPEPASALLLIVGVGGLGAARTLRARDRRP